MKITINGTSQRLPDLLGVDFDTLNESKSENIARISIQNTSNIIAYVENGKEATADGSYLLGPDREVEFNIANLSKLYFITDGSETTLRIIAT